MSRIWDDENFPKDGWKAIYIQDWGSAREGWPYCAAGCGHQIRYGHVLIQDEYGQLEVGCVCAEKLVENYDGKEQEKDFKRRINSKVNTLVDEGKILPPAKFSHVDRKTQPEVNQEVTQSLFEDRDKSRRFKARVLRIEIDYFKLQNDPEYFSNTQWYSREDVNLGGYGCVMFTPEEYARAKYEDAILRYKAVKELVDYVAVKGHEILIFPKDDKFRCLIRVNYHLYEDPYKNYPLANDVYGTQYWDSKEQAKLEAFYLTKEIISENENNLNGKDSQDDCDKE